MSNWKSSWFWSWSYQQLADNIWPKIWLYFTSHPKFYKKTYVECKIIMGNYIFQTIASIFCHNISINKCLANSFIQHDTHISTPIYFVMAEYIAKGDNHFHRLVILYWLTKGSNDTKWEGLKRGSKPKMDTWKVTSWKVLNLG